MSAEALGWFGQLLPSGNRCTIVRTECPRRGSNRPGTGRPLQGGIDVANGTCSIEGCERKNYCRGWCERHYRRWKKHGDPLWQPPTPEDRFWAKVDKNGPDGFHSQTGENLGPCWLWTAGRSDGYGVLRVGGRSVKAHRFAYKLLVGPIPSGLQPDHLCRVRLCVRPDHLEPVTSRENTLRGESFAARRAARTHCVQGHAYSPENTYVRRKGGRHCRACGRVWVAAYSARKRAA